ncbi:glycoside hydrolase family 38 C-terminal domain-containing protein [uncultured Vagococcus sp.]|uniref:glycoside hydrolase family 38 N-terminal domain-containing protein n=1 Tax=uncultured Vagococcus sp. TaxID=189676 RepID=UPI0028D74F9E|nr:glycoside hydrolase family 38 C-terminal domain-containing protein [uncultured Vagococcus sp.]
MSKKRIHIVPHTHWDKEWYFTASRSKVYLMRQVQEILEVLSTNPSYTSYLLDGQTSLVEDYLRYYPNDKAKISEMIRTKRLLTGPWYTQTDQLVISPESIVRNLYYGIKGAQKLGHSMTVAYVPDAFGQGANMPQIYQQFGIDSFLFWRGIADDRLDQLEFIWEGADGTQVLANQMYFAYYYGLNMPQDSETLPDYIDSVMTPLEARSTSQALYFPCGGDQSPVQRNLVEVVDQMNQKDPTREYLLSNPELFFNDLKHATKDLPVISGEMSEGKNSRIHKSIYSTRADLKQANNRIENKLTNVLEPLLAISHSLGNRYPHKEIEEIWKLLFENAAHDSIGGCNSDETNQDIKARYKLAEDMVTHLLDLHMREIAMNIAQQQKYALTIFNTLPYQRGSILDTYLYIPDGEFKIVGEDGKELTYSILSKVDQSDYLLNQFAYLTPHLYRKEMGDHYIPNKVYYARLQIEVPLVPAMGYTQLYLLPNEQPQQQHLITTNATNSIENDFYHVCYQAESNSFSVTHKETQQTYEQQFTLIDNGDDGDSYNYSPPLKDWLISSADAQNIAINVEINQLVDCLILTYELPLPANLAERAAGIQSVTVPVTQRISLVKGEKLVRVSMTIDNRAKDHRMCLHNPTGIRAKNSIADKLFGVEPSALRHPAMDYWEKDKWTEAPISINPMQSFVALTDETTTVAVMTEGVREYEIIGETFSDIQLTLFRSFGHMGKENLVYRPGRASGEKIVETPDAQLQGPLTFEIGVIYEDATFDEVTIAKTSKEYLTPLQQYELTDFLNGRTIFKKNVPESKKLKTHYSLLDFGEANVILSTIKKTEMTDNLLYRIYNPFINQVIDLAGVVTQQDVAVGLDEVTQAKPITQLTHNQFQTFIRTL